MSDTCPSVRFGCDVFELEDRTTPNATTFVLDFTPDNRAGTFAQTFSDVRLSNGYAPRFLDFDGNGVVNSADATAAAPQIASLVAGYYRNFTSLNLTVRYGDVLTDTKLGNQWLNYGRAYSDQLAEVMYLGGRVDASTFGTSPLANDGSNVEGYGQTFTRTIAESLLRSNPSATAHEFAVYVASTAAHEIGHLLGLRHSTSGTVNNLMNHGRTRGSDSIVNATVNTEGGRAQNGYAEVTASLRGQPTENRNYNGGQRDELVNDSEEELMAFGEEIEPAETGEAVPTEGAPAELDPAGFDPADPTPAALDPAAAVVTAPAPAAALAQTDPAAAVVTHPASADPAPAGSDPTASVATAPAPAAGSTENAPTAAVVTEVVPAELVPAELDPAAAVVTAPAPAAARAQTDPVSVRLPAGPVAIFLSPADASVVGSGQAAPPTVRTPAAPPVGRLALPTDDAKRVDASSAAVASATPPRSTDVVGWEDELLLGIAVD